MRELTIYDLDAQLAEPLPDRELMSLIAFSNLAQHAAAAANNGLDVIQQSGVDNVANFGNTTVAAAVNAVS